MAIGVRSYRPAVAGNTHMVSAGHYLAAAAGFRILEQGGNATDAGVAAGITINVVLPQWTSFGGVAPIIIHDAGRKETVSISGLGRWPAAASIDYFKQRHGGDLPPGVLRTVTPAAADAWLTALRLYGTMSFEQVVTPALEIADQGFPVPASLHSALARSGDLLAADSTGDARWPSKRRKKRGKRE
jgi:gamma-glutamyltranspeptidase/glutathione hydrolase